MISIIIPIYNEADNLKLLLSKLKPVLASLKNFELLLVNDGSNDDSMNILNSLAEKDPDIQVIHLARNFGQTAALMAGIDHSSGEIIVAMDADLQNNPEDIPKLLTALDEGYDVVSGWRRHRKDAPIKKVFLSKIANILISKISGVKIHDFGCSLKAYRRKALVDVRLYGEMHRFIPIYAAWRGASITEVEVSHFSRTHGQSHYGLERIYKVIMDLIVVKFLYEYTQKPMYLFGGFGILSWTIGSLAGLASLYYKIWGQKSFVETPLPLLFVMCFITGIICFLMGLIAELVVRVYYESQEKRTYVLANQKPSKA